MGRYALPLKSVLVGAVLVPLLLVFTLLPVPVAAQPFSAQLQQFYNWLIHTPQTVTGTWTFQNVVINGTCTGGGCGGGGGAFSAITSGTNTTAAMVVGTGASLGVSGTGTVQATSSPGNFPVTGQFYAPLVDDGNSGTADTIDWNGGNEHYSTLTGNVTYTFSNPQSGGRYVLVIATGAGSFSVTWPASVLWPGGATPTITTTASKVDVCAFTYVSGTAKYYGACSQNY